MEQVNRVMSTVFENKYSSTIVTVIILLYASLARPKLPNFMVNLFENPIFRVLFLSLIVYKGNRDPLFSIMIAIAFTVTMNLISQQKFFENFADQSSHGTGSTHGSGSAHGSGSNSVGDSGVGTGDSEGDDSDSDGDMTDGDTTAGGASQSDSDA